MAKAYGVVIELGEQILNVLEDFSMDLTGVLAEVLTLLCNTGSL